MRNRRLIVTSVIAIVLISILFIGNTYSIFTTNEADPNTNVYTTGNLDITYELSSDNIKFTKSKPIGEEDIDTVDPYRIKITNSGNVDYKFDVKLEDTTATSVIDYNYIMVKVGKYDSIPLSKAKNNIVKKDIIVKAKSSVLVDVKIYLSYRIPNSEIGKNFSAKLSVNGIAVVYDQGDVDNSDLVSNYLLLSNVKVGSYVDFDNCTSDSCRLDNANYINDDNMGYCYNASNKYNVNGWRVAYIKDNIVYLVSAGAIDCYDKVDENTNFIEDLHKIVVNYCNDKYVYGAKCNNNVWAFNTNDFKNISNVDLSNCIGTSSVLCGYDNSLINNGGYYWIVDNTDNLKQYYWNAIDKNISSTSKLDQGYGVRVVMKLQEGLYVKSGSGEYTNPYIIFSK